MKPQDIEIGLPDSVAKGDISFNEILFNPYSGGSDFVELYNKSAKILSITNKQG